MGSPVDEPTESIDAFRTGSEGSCDAPRMCPLRSRAPSAPGKAYRRALCDAGLAGVSYSHGDSEGAGLSARSTTGVSRRESRASPWRGRSVRTGLGQWDGAVLIDHASDALRQRLFRRRFAATRSGVSSTPSPVGRIRSRGAHDPRRSRRRRMGDHRQKVWTSQAHIADFGILRRGPTSMSPNTAGSRCSPSRCTSRA